MNPQKAYNSWAEQYDSNENKTRDLEAKALRRILGAVTFDRCLEIGSGTGKNTEWLSAKSPHITCVDLSEEMMAKAKEKIASPTIRFIQADINDDWNFTNETYGLITFSLVLEHIENLDHIFKEVYKLLEPGGLVYIGELHPFKQYTGTKARFETAEGLQIVQCYNHHISDFVQSAKKYGLSLLDMDEYFDDEGKSGVPRIITLLLKKREL